MDRIDKILRENGLMSLSHGTGIPSPTLTEKQLAEQRVENLRKSLWISTTENTFDNFRPAPGTEAAIKAARDLAEGKAKYAMLLIYGGVGNGKTYICEATSLALYSQGQFCRVLAWPDIVRALRIAMNGGGANSPDELIELYCKSKRLIVDDVGAGMSGTDFGMKELEEIIDYRYHEKLFTLATTNKDIKELPERVLSRFRDKQISCLVLNKGADYRLKK